MDEFWDTASLTGRIAHQKSSLCARISIAPEQRVDEGQWNATTNPHPSVIFLHWEAMNHPLQEKQTFEIG